MISTATDFAFLGTRDYIHGTTLLSAFLDAMEQQTAEPIVVKRIKFQRPARTNGELLLGRENFEAARMDTANCTFVASAGGVTWRGLFAESGAAVPRREPVVYSIAGLQASRFGGTCRIVAKCRDELIRAFVEANKRFHEAETDAAPAIRFGYLENWQAPARDAPFSGELQAVNLIAKKTDSGCMTINRIAYTDAAGTSAAFTVCFEMNANLASRS